MKGLRKDVLLFWIGCSVVLDLLFWTRSDWIGSCRTGSGAVGLDDVGPVGSGNDES